MSKPQTENLAPLPWVLSHAYNWRDALQIVDADYGTVCIFSRGYEDGPSWTNARMCAAAPEMYEALEALVADLKEYERSNNLHPNPGRTECWDSTTRAVAALKKARGES